jgi:hypothetical protein
MDVHIVEGLRAFVPVVQPAYVSIRQHTSAYASIRQHTPAYVSIRQHTSSYVSIRQHTSAYASIPFVMVVQLVEPAVEDGQVHHTVPVILEDQLPGYCCLQPLQPLQEQEQNQLLQVEV